MCTYNCVHQHWCSWCVHTTVYINIDTVDTTYNYGVSTVTQLMYTHSSVDQEVVSTLVQCHVWCVIINNQCITTVGEHLPHPYYLSHHQFNDLPLLCAVSSSPVSQLSSLSSVPSLSVCTHQLRRGSSPCWRTLSPVSTSHRCWLTCWCCWWLLGAFSLRVTHWCQQCFITTKRVPRDLIAHYNGLLL